MPAPASDAIASDVGHGALGLRYGLRPFRDLLSETVGQRHLWVELRPKTLVSAWTSDGGGLYHATGGVAETFDGLTLPVVGVRTLTETLVRYEAGRVLVAGTYSWSESTHALYVYLTAGASPASTTVVAELGVHVGSHGVVHPILGPDRLTNGTLEAWTGTVPDGWSHAETAGVTLDKTASDPLQGAYAARLTFAAAVGPAGADLYQDFTTLVAGQVYRISGAYRSSQPSLFAHLAVWDTAAAFLSSDGRTMSGTYAMSDSSAVEWRRFAFDFLCPSWATVRVQVTARTPAGTQSGTVDFDDVKLQHVQRYAYHEPLLSADSVPTIEAARADAFWGPVNGGLGSLSLLNGNGRLEPLIAAYDWMGADAIIRVGGRFQLGGNETLIEDCPVVAMARLASPRVSDGGVLFDLRDDKEILKRTLPERAVEDATGVGTIDEGRPRVLAFGAVRNSSPPRIGLSANGFGIYELADTQYGTVPTPKGTSVSDAGDVYSYASEEAANKEDAQLRVILHGADFSFVAGGGAAGNTIEVLNDVAPIILSSENNCIDFNIGGGSLVARMAPRRYLPAHSGTGDAVDDPVGDPYLCNTLASYMCGVSGETDIQVTLSASTHKYTISKTAGTLQLLCSTGVNRDLSLWGALGFNTSADRTGALSYTGDTAVAKLADGHVIRLGSTEYSAGYLDDAAGTYTGSANAQIYKGPDIAYFLLRKVLGVPVDRIDLPSFVAGRTGAKTLAAYIGEVTEVGAIFERIEAGENVDIQSEAGVWFWRPRSAGTVPTPVIDVLESDILSFVGLYEPGDNYQIVRLGYNPSVLQGPSRRDRRRDAPGADGAKTKQDSTTSKALIRFGRPDQRTWQTYLTSSSDAATRVTQIATLAGKKPRRYEVVVKGKTLLLPPGAKFRLTRSRGLGTTPPAALLLRILGKSDAWGNWTSQMLAIEDDPA